MSGIVAVIPFRGTPQAKTRLATLFDGEARERLMRHMLCHVLDTLDRSGVIDSTLIVTRDTGALPDGIVGPPRRQVIVQAGEGLNAAIELGRSHALAAAHTRMLTLLPDLPMIAAADVHAAVAPSAPVAVARDRHGTGTNGLLLALDGPAARLPLRFGSQSAARHIAEVERLGLVWTSVDAPGLRHDLDTPEDWWALPGPRRRELLASIEVPPFSPPGSSSGPTWSRPDS